MNRSPKKEITTQMNFDMVYIPQRSLCLNYAQQFYVKPKTKRSLGKSGNRCVSTIKTNLKKNRLWRCKLD